MAFKIRRKDDTLTVTQQTNWALILGLGSLICLIFVVVGSFAHPRMMDALLFLFMAIVGIGMFHWTKLEINNRTLQIRFSSIGPMCVPCKRDLEFDDIEKIEISVHKDQDYTSYRIALKLQSSETLYLNSNGQQHAILPYFTAVHEEIMGFPPALTDFNLFPHRRISMKEMPDSEDKS